MNSIHLTTTVIPVRRNSSMYHIFCGDIIDLHSLLCIDLCIDNFIQFRPKTNSKNKFSLAH